MWFGDSGKSTGVVLEVRVPLRMLKVPLITRVKGRKYRLREPKHRWCPSQTFILYSLLACAKWLEKGSFKGNFFLRTFIVTVCKKMFHKGWFIRLHSLSSEFKILSFKILYIYKHCIFRFCKKNNRDFLL